jgi:hypothetical protein
MGPDRENDNPFEPWNNEMYRDDPFAPWNDPMKDTPFACWNNVFGRGDYREEVDKEYRRK